MRSGNFEDVSLLQSFNQQQLYPQEYKDLLSKYDQLENILIFELVIRHTSKGLFPGESITSKGFHHICRSALWNIFVAGKNSIVIMQPSKMSGNDPDIAHQQGADFMLQCIKMFLDPVLPVQPLSAGIPDRRRSTPVSVSSIAKCAQELLGAMELMARVSRAQVVATCSTSISLNCLRKDRRIPLKMPILDMNQVMEAVPEL
eukprot:gene28612-37810_t